MLFFSFLANSCRSIGNKSGVSYVIIKLLEKDILYNNTKKNNNDNIS